MIPLLPISPWGADELALILLLASVIDALLGDPPWLYRRVLHPVAVLGEAIEDMERRLNRRGRGRLDLILRGAFATLALLAATTLVAWLFEGLCRLMPGGLYLEAVVASSLLAWRGLHDHVAAVAAALPKGLAAARLEVAKIVGRNPDSLDGPGIARAAVESLAENFSDGVVAPLFWFALLGLPGLLAYKCLNTLDSMIGHRSERYEAFGKVAARLDDAANWIPARLSGLLIALAALFLPGARAGGALRAMARDARHHRSPNAGWQEAAFAGALDFALAGPRHYASGKVEDAWMGDGNPDLGPRDLKRALALYRVAGGVILALLVAAVLLLVSLTPA